MNILKYKNLFLIIAGLLVVGSIAVICIAKINPSIEFTGGTLIEYTFDQAPVAADVAATLAPITGEAPRVQSLGESSVVVRTAEADEATIQKMTEALTAKDSSVKLARSSTIGPSLGKELKKKAVIALIVTIILIILYVAFAFRRVSKPIASWKYGIVVIITLLHDVVIPFAIVLLLGREFDTLMVVGLLSILGLSVNDTIVVFDRIRENLQIAHSDKVHHHFDTIVGESLSQTIRRSLVTSTSIILVTLILAFFGPEATRTLALILALGTVFGTYSSIFVASPLLVLWEKGSRN